MTDIVKQLRTFGAEGFPVASEAADEIKRLRAELQYARDGLTKGQTRMREDMERLRADAARYRWLRKGIVFLDEHRSMLQIVDTLEEEAMDAAIDAAMKGKT
jgi:hypothetical protein